ncbi:hypothetical protein ACIQZN_15585 [Streptomyces sp. NPDC097595]|uniref:hypothetical protein n=1 Tax=Streptomyces sp. NPDC097595 TaxID=3366090 RepID=UPI00382BA6C2
MATVHGSAKEFEPAALSRIFAARLRERFNNPPLTVDGMVCAECEQWLNLRAWGLVGDD